MGYQFSGKFFLERGANLESRAAHNHPKNTQVPPAPGLDATIPRFDFFSSSKNKYKFQVRQTLIVVNLQAKVTPSHIGANHLRYSEKRRDEG